MRFQPYNVVPNQFSENSEKITNLRQYCEGLNLSPAKKEVLAVVFNYAEDAFCVKTDKPTDPARFVSYNKIINAIDASDLGFLDVVLAEVGEFKNLASSRFPLPVARLVVNNSKLLSTIAPVADQHRKAELKSEATWLLAMSQAYWFFLIANYLLSTPERNYSATSEVASSLLHSAIYNLVTAVLTVTTLSSLRFSTDIVGIHKSVRAMATFFTNSAHTDGALKILPAAEVSRSVDTPVKQ